MITVTQFNRNDLRIAKQHLARLPQPAAGPAVAAAAPPEEQVSTNELSQPAEAAVSSAVPPGDESAAPTADSESNDANSTEAPDTGGEVLPPAVALLVREMGLTEKRAACLVEAVSLAGNRLDRVRQVTVVQGEGAPARATLRGELGYLIELEGGTSAGDRDRRGGRGRRGGPGGGRGGRGGPGGGRGGPRSREGGADPAVEGDLSGRFSMDAAAADRKRAELAERGQGKPGGGPRGPGGGRGGRRGGPRGPGGGPGGGRGGPRGPGGGPGGGRGGPRGPGGGP